MLAAMPRQSPGHYQRSHDVTVALSYADLGIHKMQASRWQRVASLDDSGDVLRQHRFVARSSSRTAAFASRTNTLDWLGQQRLNHLPLFWSVRLLG